RNGQDRSLRGQFENRIVQQAERRGRRSLQMQFENYAGTLGILIQILGGFDDEIQKRIYAD
ncbi:MAG: hypothetical protein RR759_06580, partial [Ruthenibacterium sp.]